MKIAIMQPYFFPYLGYFSLIKHTDQFVLLDEVQFIRHGWIERNRILKQDGEWLYIKVPLIKSGRDSLIKECRINGDQNWEERIFSQMVTYKKIAPYYNEVVDLLKEVFSKNYQTITELNREALELVCTYLSIKCNINVFSDMNLDIDEPAKPDDWALNICKAIGGVEEYWNPPGGADLFDRAKYENQKIRIFFPKVNIIPYNQKRKLFIPALSILDVMMFNSVEDIHSMLDNYDFL
jgi:hypothetical protein